MGRAEKGTLVWLHGFSDRPAGFLRTALHLARDHRVVAPALPAFHDGWVDPEEAHTIPAYGAWLEPVLRDAVSEPMVLVGNSLGGAVALELAHRMGAEAVRGVVALNAAGVQIEGVDDVTREFERGESPFEVREREHVHRLFSRIVGREIRIPSPFDAALFGDYAANADWYLRLGEDLRGTPARIEQEGWLSAVDLEAIDLPVLVLWGDRDTLFPLSHAERMVESLPQGRLELLEGIGHSAHIQRPERLAASIRHFVGTLP